LSVREALDEQKHFFVAILMLTSSDYFFYFPVAILFSISVFWYLLLIWCLFDCDRLKLQFKLQMQWKRKETRREKKLDIQNWDDNLEAVIIDCVKPSKKLQWQP
jgi:hypothetical protein